MKGQTEKYTWSNRLRPLLRLAWLIVRGHTRSRGIWVFGRKAFRENVAAALDLLGELTPDVLALVTANVEVVVQDAKAGLLIDCLPDTFLMMRMGDVHSRTFTAGSIATQAFYASLVRRVRVPTPVEFPDDIPDATVDMRSALFLRSVLRRLGAPKSETDLSIDAILRMA